MAKSTRRSVKRIRRNSWVSYPGRSGVFRVSDLSLNTIEDKFVATLQNASGHEEATDVPVSSLRLASYRF